MTPRQERSAIIETARVDAARLMSAANSDSMKRYIQLALRDLNDAISWLNHTDGDSATPVLAVADVAIRGATARLEFVAVALDRYGPDATTGA
jgi:hypothetical protein